MLDSPNFAPELNNHIMPSQANPLRVKDIMTAEVLRISPESGIRDAAKMFDKYNIRHAPVVQNGKLVGIVSLTDIQRLSFGPTYGEDEEDVDGAMADMLTVGQVMRYRPVTVGPNEYVKDVATLLTQAEFHALPVVEDEKLVGIVTTTDIIRTLLNYL